MGASVMKKTAVESALHGGAIVISNIEVGVVLDDYLVDILSFNAHGFEAPQVVVGICRTRCPSGEVLLTANHVGTVIIRAVEGCIKVVIIHAVNVVGTADGEFVIYSHQRCVCTTRHEGISVAILNSNLSATERCNLPNAVVGRHLCIGLQGEAEA